MDLCWIEIKLQLGWNEIGNKQGWNEIGDKQSGIGMELCWNKNRVEPGQIVEWCLV